jgi:hypothetical protein
MEWRHGILSTLVAVNVIGCASVDNNRSYVEAIPQVDAIKLGSIIADYIKDSYPAANTTLILIPPQAGQANNPFTNALLQSLSHAGFGLADPTTAGGPNYHRFSYYVTAFDGGVLVRLTVDGKQATRCYVQDERGIVPLTPLAVGH